MSESGAWPWPEESEAAGGPEADTDLARCFARCLRGADGERVLAHLRAITIERRTHPSAGEADLRHLEGQRFLTAYIAAMARLGRG